MPPFLYICGNFQCSVDYSKTTRKLLSVVRKCSGTYKIKANALPGLNCWICFAPAFKRWFYCAVLIFLSFHYWFLLAHLSRRLIWWAYCLGRLRRPSTRPLSARRPHCSNIFSSETTGPIEAKFHMEPPWVGGTKDCSGDLGHMTMMTNTPKNPFKNLWNQRANDLGAWYAASGTWVQQILFKRWPWVNLDLF